MLEAVGGLVLLVAVAQVSTIQLSCKESQQADDYNLFIRNVRRRSIKLVHKACSFATSGDAA